MEAGSIAGGARALGLPRETVGRRLAALEERLGVRLLHRTTRRLGTTSAGEELARRARRILAEAEAAVASIRSTDGVLRGKLRVSVPPLQGNRRFGAMVVAFLEQWPEVEIELVATARHVDLLAEGFDLAIRAGAVTDPGLVARRIGGSPVRVVASPRYLARRGTPRGAGDLVHHECIRGMPRGGQPVHGWPLWAGGNVPISGRLATDDLALQVEAALSGLGLALLPEVVVGTALQDGSLVAVVPEIGADAPVSAVFPSRDHLDPKVRALVDHVAAWFERDAAPGGC